MSLHSLVLQQIFVENFAQRIWEITTFKFKKVENLLLFLRVVIFQNIWVKFLKINFSDLFQRDESTIHKKNWRKTNNREKKSNKNKTKICRKS